MHGSGAPPPHPPSPVEPPPAGGFGAPSPHGYAPMQRSQPSPKQLADAQRGADLVRLSTWLLAGGAVLLIGGCGSTVLVGAFGMFGVIAGIFVIVAAAIVGQVGRGLQGRVI